MLISLAKLSSVFFVVELFVLGATIQERPLIESYWRCPRTVWQTDSGFDSRKVC
ncbi:hypothetical protein [Stieleria mannarensis]|uniref:hypothetical protein n=1 Tax=Stieleria mannarensis TaxID=2755585 RepID=UPI0016014A3C|nr:hypothetical protein [Rhodopirellula sp. JC639]